MNTQVSKEDVSELVRVLKEHFPCELLFVSHDDAHDVETVVDLLMKLSADAYSMIDLDHVSSD